MTCDHSNLIELSYDPRIYRCGSCGAEGYLTKKGRLLTYEEIEALAEEAERGYDVSHLKDRER